MQAAMVMEALWLKTPRPIKATNTKELLSNCKAGMMGGFKKRKHHGNSDADKETGCQHHNWQPDFVGSSEVLGAVKQGE